MHFKWQQIFQTWLSCMLFIIFSFSWTNCIFKASTFPNMSSLQSDGGSFPTPVFERKKEYQYYSIICCSKKTLKSLTSEVVFILELSTLYVFTSVVLAGTESKSVPLENSSIASSISPTDVPSSSKVIWEKYKNHFNLRFSLHLWLKIHLHCTVPW